MRVGSVSWKKMVSVLRMVGIGQDVIQKAKSELTGLPTAPRVPRKVVTQLRQVVSTYGKAIITFGDSGKYRVYSPEGHDMIRKNGHSIHKKEAVAAEA